MELPYWFFNVWWEEKKIFIDCLVEPTNLENEICSYLVEEDGALKIYKSENYPRWRSLSVIGQVIRWVVYQA